MQASWYCSWYVSIIFNKNIERENRGESSNVLVKRLHPQIPRDFQRFLLNCDNKTRMTDVISEYIDKHKASVQHITNQEDYDFAGWGSLPEVILGKAVPKICSKFTEGHPCRNAISIKLQSNFIKITHRHGCSPVNLLYILRTPFLKNTSGRLLLYWITNAFQFRVCQHQLKNL